MQHAVVHGVMLRRTGTLPQTVLITAPALQRTAPQALRAALRPGNERLPRGTRFLQITGQRLNSPTMADLASVLKCSWKPITAAEVSALTPSSVLTACTVKK